MLAPASNRDGPPLRRNRASSAASMAIALLACWQIAGRLAAQVPPSTPPLVQPEHASTAPPSGTPAAPMLTAADLEAFLDGLLPAQIAQDEIDRARGNQQKKHGLGEHLARDAEQAAGSGAGQLIGAVGRQLPGRLIPSQPARFIGHGSPHRGS